METSPTINAAVLDRRPPHHEIDQRVLELPTHVLECRAANHYMPTEFAIRVRLREMGQDLWEKTFTCLRCTMVRIDVTDRYSGKLKRRRYVPGDDYRASQKGGGRIPRADVRLELDRRIWPNDD